MVRCTREESRAITRERLLASATLLFGRDGYAATSVERIAEAAGYSKGAVYSNFPSKEAIFLAVLDRQGQDSLDRVIGAIEAAAHEGAVREALVAWADDRSGSGIWSLTILEHARLAGPESCSLKRQREILEGHWLQLGERVRQRIPRITAEPLTLGALLHEIAYAPAMTFVERPTAGALMRLVLEAWIA
jgi:AcrR family transcriptional regulator